MDRSKGGGPDTRAGSGRAGDETCDETGYDDQNLDRMHDPRPPGGGGVFLTDYEGDTVGNKG